MYPILMPVFRVITYAELGKPQINEWYKVPREVLMNYINYGQDWFSIDIRSEDMLQGEMARVTRATVYDKNKKNKWYAMLPEILRPHYLHEVYEVTITNGEPQIPITLRGNWRDWISDEEIGKIKLFRYLNI